VAYKNYIATFSYMANCTINSKTYKFHTLITDLAKIKKSLENHLYDAGFEQVDIIHIEALNDIFSFVLPK
jgi:hypothetical protein